MRNYKRFRDFVWERMRIYERKEVALAPPPWTKDPILQKYSFTNVFREHDRTTRWIARNWRHPNGGHPDLWFAMMVARMVNRPATLQTLGYPRRWDREKFERVLREVKARDGVMLSAAYIISTNGQAVDKVTFLGHTLGNAWSIRDRVRLGRGDTLASFAERLRRVNGLGSFLTGQIIADVKQERGQPIYMSNDRATWATPGPGSRRGLNRVQGAGLHDHLRDAVWLEAVQELRKMINADSHPIMKPLDAQDTQNCLCEFDKYERTRLGEGRPKRHYTPTTKEV